MSCPLAFVPGMCFYAIPLVVFGTFTFLLELFFAPSYEHNLPSVIRERIFNLGSLLLFEEAFDSFPMKLDALLDALLALRDVRYGDVMFELSR